MITEDELAVVPEAPAREPEQVGEALPLYLQEIGRVKLLTDYQDAAYGERYRRRMLAVAESDRRERSRSGLFETIARSLYKLMPYKDEY